MEAGKEFGLLPIGLGARDSLRFEAGLPLCGHEYTESIGPLEAGYGFFVKVDKAGGFIGQPVLKLQKEEGLKHRTVALRLEDKGVPRHGMDVAERGGARRRARHDGRIQPLAGRQHRLVLRGNPPRPPRESISGSSSETNRNRASWSSVRSTRKTTRAEELKH